MSHEGKIRVMVALDMSNGDWEIAGKFHEVSDLYYKLVERLPGFYWLEAPRVIQNWGGGYDLPALLVLLHDRDAVPQFTRAAEELLTAAAIYVGFDEDVEVEPPRCIVEVSGIVSEAARAPTAWPMVGADGPVVSGGGAA